MLGFFALPLGRQLFRNFRDLPTSDKLRQEDCRQQTDNREKGARFRNRVDHQRELFEPAVTRIGSAEMAIQINKVGQGGAGECAHRYERKHVAKAVTRIAGRVQQHSNTASPALNVYRSVPSKLKLVVFKLPVGPV